MYTYILIPQEVLDSWGDVTGMLGTEGSKDFTNINSAM